MFYENEFFNFCCHLQRRIARKLQHLPKICGIKALTMRKLRAMVFFQKFFVLNKLIQTTLRPIRWKLCGKEDTYSEEVVEIVFFYYHMGQQFGSILQT